MKYYKSILTISVETLRSLEKQLVEKAGQVQELAEVIVENEETGFLNIITGMARILHHCQVWQDEWGGWEDLQGGGQDWSSQPGLKGWSSHPGLNGWPHSRQKGGIRCFASQVLRLTCSWQEQVGWGT